MTNRLRAFLIFVLISVSLSTFAEDARPVMKSFKGMALFSWKDSRGSWSFSLLRGTNRNKLLAEIQEPSGVILDVEALGKRFAMLAEEENVYWFLTDDKDLSYPDQETISRIFTLAAEHKITLHK